MNWAMHLSLAQGDAELALSFATNVAYTIHTTIDLMGAEAVMYRMEVSNGCLTPPS